MIRRLAIVACALGALHVAAFAQTAKKDAEVLYPRTTTADAPATAGKPSDSNFLLVVLGGGAAVAGGWMLWRQRRTPGGIAGRDARKLVVAESRSLGNRQYLVVADYEGRKFLLGVCPGSIQLLSALDDDEPAPRV
jgi:flagellar protein FliO/FliZ